MTTEHPITRDLGKAERTLRGLLDSMIAPAGLNFPEWVALTMLAGSGPLSRQDLTIAIVQSKVATHEDATLIHDSLEARGLIVNTNGEMSNSKAGEALYGSLKAKVDNTVSLLHADLSDSDLDATRRVLIELTNRAEDICLQQAI